MKDVIGCTFLFLVVIIGCEKPKFLPQGTFRYSKSTLSQMQEPIDSVIISFGSDSLAVYSEYAYLSDKREGPKMINMAVARYSISDDSLYFRTDWIPDKEYQELLLSKAKTEGKWTEFETYLSMIPFEKKYEFQLVNKGELLILKSEKSSLILEKY